VIEAQLRVAQRFARSIAFGVRLLERAGLLFAAAAQRIEVASERVELLVALGAGVAELLLARTELEVCLLDLSGELGNLVLALGERGARALGERLRFAMRALVLGEL